MPATLAAYKRSWENWDSFAAQLITRPRMVPTPLHSPRSSRLILTLLSLLSQHVPNITRNLSLSGDTSNNATLLHTYAKRATSDPGSPEFIVFACLIPVLVLLSGVFAGLTLGYMSLDETQLNVLSISGTPSVSPMRMILYILTHLSVSQPAETLRC